MEKVVPLIGRVLLALIFLMSGFNKISDFAGTREDMAQAGIPMTSLLLIGALVFEVGGALLLIAGLKTRWGALALVIFLIPTTLVFHSDFANPAQMTHFLKNLSILGGLLVVAAFGPGPLSLDGRARG